MSLPSKYTEEDWAAWLEENPWDEELGELITDTIGFHLFILDRRTREVGGAVRAEYERLRDSINQKREEFVRRYFSS